MTRSERLARAIRRNAAGHAMPGFLEEMSERLGRDVAASDVLSFDASDALDRAVKGLTRPRISQRDLSGHQSADGTLLLITNDENEGEAFLAQTWAGLSPSTELWLASPGSEICGAVRATVGELISRGFALTWDDEPLTRAADPVSGKAAEFSVDTDNGHAPREWTICRCAIAPLLPDLGRDVGR